MIEQDTHETSNLGPSCVGERCAIHSVHLSQPALNDYRPDISDIQIGPAWAYPPFKKLPVDDSGGVRMPVSFLGKFGLYVMID